MRPLVIYGNPLLQKDLSQIDVDPAAARSIQEDFELACRRYRGSGIAAPQIGLEIPVMWIAAHVKLNGKAVGELCIKPSYEADEAVSLVDADEGCLSLPGRLFRVRRPAVITAHWTNNQGHRRKKKMAGYKARVFMHETDHLHGLTIMETGTLVAVKR